MKDPRHGVLVPLIAVPFLMLPFLGCTPTQGAGDSSAFSSVFGAEKATNADVSYPTEAFVLEHGYPTNAQGQTYGPPTGDFWPDLMLAEGNNGVQGYVYTSDLTGEPPTTIEEALARNPDEPFDIPVYKSDGITVIDTFTVNGSAL